MVSDVTGQRGRPGSPNRPKDWRQGRDSFGPLPGRGIRKRWDARFIRLDPAPDPQAGPPDAEPWWTRGGSNPRPHGCRPCALPAELRAHENGAGHGTRTRFSGLEGQGTTHIPVPLKAWWTRRESNPRPLHCKCSAFPLGYEPTGCLGSLLYSDVADLRRRQNIPRTWSGRGESNPPPEPWQGPTLPLSYARPKLGTGGGIRTHDMPVCRTGGFGRSPHPSKSPQKCKRRWKPPSALGTLDWPLPTQSLRPRAEYRPRPCHSRTRQRLPPLLCILRVLWPVPSCSLVHIIPPVVEKSREIFMGWLSARKPAPCSRVLPAHFRRRTPAIPRRPMPTRPRLAGSGVDETSPVQVPSPVQ